jgi:ABC-type enterochelin transport system substrate-binding protein
MILMGEKYRETMDYAIKIARTINKHLDEKNCRHSIRKIMEEVGSLPSDSPLSSLPLRT